MFNFNPHWKIYKLYHKIRVIYTYRSSVRQCVYQNRNDNCTDALSLWEKRKEKKSLWKICICYKFTIRRDKNNVRYLQSKPII